MKNELIPHTEFPWDIKDLRKNQKFIVPQARKKIKAIWADKQCPLYETAGSSTPWWSLPKYTTLTVTGRSIRKGTQVWIPVNATHDIEGFILKEHLLCCPKYSLDHEDRKTVQPKQDVLDVQDVPKVCKVGSTVKSLNKYLGLVTHINYDRLPSPEHKALLTIQRSNGEDMLTWLSDCIVLNE